MNFLEKAKATPDLQDFCEYLELPLKRLKEIHARYLQLSKDTQAILITNHLKVKKILEYHLPQLVDNYCQLSFDYRNTFILKKVAGSPVTAKDILLQNLARIIEEINFLEIEFNRYHSHKLLVQEKSMELMQGHTSYINDLGYQGDKIILPNKFRYDPKQIFNSKARVVKEETYLQDPHLEQELFEEEIEEKKSSRIWVALLFISFFIIMLVFLWKFFEYKVHLEV